MDKFRFMGLQVVLLVVLIVVLALLFFAAGVKADTVYLPYVRNTVVAGQCTFTDVGSMAYIPEVNMRVVVAGLQTLIIYPCGYDGRYGDITLEVWARLDNSTPWNWERITFFGKIPSCTPGQFVQRAIPNHLPCNTYDPMILAFDENGYLVGSGTFY